MKHKQNQPRKYYVNQLQTSHERRVKYWFMHYAGLPRSHMDKMRDWTISHIIQFLYNNKHKPTHKTPPEGIGQC